MHEYSVVQALVEQVEAQMRQRGATRVHRLRVKLGELSGVDPELFRTAYETFREGTVCAAAPLELATVEARWVCRRCERPIPKGGPLQCGACGAPGRLAEGEEILLDQMDLEVP